MAPRNNVAFFSTATISEATHSSRRDTRPLKMSDCRVPIRFPYRDLQWPITTVAPTAWYRFAAEWSTEALTQTCTSIAKACYEGVSVGL